MPCQTNISLLRGGSLGTAGSGAAAARFVGADQMGRAFLPAQGLVVFGAGQAPAKTGAAHFQVVALLDGVGLVKDRVDGTGDSLAGVGVQRRIPVNQDPQEPVRAFLFKADIPQPQAHALHSGTDQLFHRCGGTTCSLRVFGFAHRATPYHKKKADLCGPLP